MPNDYAIRLRNVSKIYKLHGSQRDQLVDILGLHRLGIKPRVPCKEFIALDNVNLEVPRGHRIGIVGRNGAGKTTLLKLLCGNFAPTSGTVEVNGEVQALMNVGLGFHPEYTGRENVEASLQYNGLNRNEYQQAMDGIIEFCELGDFLDQPFKTYSLGMQARLMFASATAIRPDILIVDEVLGAGDAYFVAKSKRRVEKLVNSGCTMLLVSHSMQQVLELCNEVIWIDQGKIQMKGDAFTVVKAYEEFLHSRTNPHKASNSRGLPSSGSGFVGGTATANISIKEIQEPRFTPFAEEDSIPAVFTPNRFCFIEKGGLSRWEGEVGLKFCGFSITTERGTNNSLVALRPAKLCISIVAEVSGEYDCRYGVSISDHSGVCLTNIFSPRDNFFLNKGEVRSICVHLNPCQLGSGNYVIGMSILAWGDLELINSTRRYDLLSRSFSLNVEVPESMAAINAAFFHNAEWIFS